MFRDITQEVEGWLEHHQQLYLYGCGIFSQLGIIEIGSFKGLSTCYFCQGIRDVPEKNVKVISIDPHEGNPEHHQNDPNFKNTYSEFMFNLGKYDYQNLVIPVIGKSWDVFHQFPDNSVDVLFIDGLHEFDAVKKDFELYLPKVISGGRIVIHDCRTDNNTTWDEVCRAFQEIIAPNPQVYNFVNVESMVVCSKR